MKLISAFTLMAIGTVGYAQTADLAGDFGSGGSNPSGNWTYGYFPSTVGIGFTPFTIYTSSANSLAWSAPQSGGQLGTPAAYLYLGPPSLGVNTGQFAVHPGPAEVTVARFVVPTSWGSGLATISGAFGQGDLGKVGGHVLVNGTSLFSQMVDAATPFSLSSVSLNAGDTIDFAVDNFDGFTFDTTPVDAHIEYAPVPEPATLAVIGFGAAILLKRRRK